MTVDLDTTCVLDGHRYQLVTEEGVAAWQRVGHVNLHGVNPALPVSVEWDMDFANGMGVSEYIDSRSYSFSQGVWPGTKGRVHMTPIKTKVTPTRVPVDKGGWFFEDTPGGNAVFATGSFTVTGATQSVAHGLGTTPKAVYFQTTGQATGADGSIANTAVLGLGWSDGTDNGGVTWRSANGVGTTDAQRSYSNTRSILVSTAADAYEVEGHVTSFDDTNINITWTANGDEDEIVQFWVIGGEDVQAKVVEWQHDGTANNQTITGVGFSPDLVQHLGAELSSVGFGADADLGVGAMDSGGNQWSMRMTSTDGGGISGTTTVSRTSVCLDSASRFAFVSMDADGFTVSVVAGTGTNLHSALCIKGVQARVGTTTKKTSTGNQAAETIGFTTESFLVVGSRHVTSLDSTTNEASFGMGMVAGTSSVQAAAIHDEDFQSTSDTDRIFDTGAALILVDDTAITDEATCGNADMETAGWLNWSTTSATASQIHYIGLASLSKSNTKMIHYTNGQSLTKMSVSGGTITEEESHNWGADAESGEPEKFNDVWYVPLGTQTAAQKITAIGDSGTDNTYADLTNSSTPINAHAFALIADGATSKLARGLNQYVDVSAGTDDDTWSGGDDASNGFEVGDPATVITNLKATANRLAIAKQDNLYTMQPETGESEKVTPFSGAATHEHNGQGLSNVEGADAVVYNHSSGLLYFDFSRLPIDISPNAYPTNTDIAGVTHEPYATHYHETAVASPEWSYALGVVTESSTTKTYVFAIHRDRQSGNVVWQTLDTLSGAARGIFVDSENRLWIGWVGDGSIFYYQLGDDGSPHQARGADGFGTDGDTFRLYLPRIDFEHPHIKKRLHSVEVISNSSATGLTMKGAFHLDGGAEVTPLGSNFTSTYTRSKWTVNTNDTCYYCVPVIQFVTSGYTPSGANRVEIQKYRINAFLNLAADDFQEAYRIVINTGVPFSDGTRPPDDALTMRTNLAALKTGGPITGVGPDGASGTYFITDVSEPNVRLTADEDGQRRVTWVIEVSAAKWA